MRLAGNSFSAALVSVVIDGERVGGARPFEIVAARGIKPAAFTDYMNSQHLAGVSFSEYLSGPRGRQLFAD